jgi:hypothetical protein
MTPKSDPRITLLDRQTLSKRFVNLEKVTIEHATRSGGRITVEREIHDHGNAAAILLYDPARKSVVLVRQLRVPVYLNGGEGWMIEIPAGFIRRKPSRGRRWRRPAISSRMPNSSLTPTCRRAR